MGYLSQSPFEAHCKQAAASAAAAAAFRHWPEHSRFAVGVAVVVAVDNPAVAVDFLALAERQMCQ